MTNATPPGEVRYRVVHRTSYRYEVPMIDGYTVAHLLPRATPWQEIVASDVHVQPEPAEYDEFTDVFGNRVLQFGVHRPHATLYSAILREIKHKGADARFTKTDRGHFALAKGA